MEPSTQSQPSDPIPTGGPVMDIKVPPRPTPGEPVKAPPAEVGEATPESIDLKKKADKKAKPPKSPKTHGSGTSLAIVATVIIVLGLGALFVYAYLRTQGSGVF